MTSGIDIESFWKLRLQTVGHTGWLDPKIYSFDQICRLHVFESWLASKRLRPGTGFEFGCGTADFSRLLNKKGWNMVAYDKFIAPKYQAPSFRFINSVAGEEFSAAFDLLVSVTVLDHLVDDDEFVQTLQRFRTMIRPDGRFFFLEYSPASEADRSSYQALRSMPVWIRALEIAGFSVTEVIPFFHPMHAPVPAWSTYEQMGLTKITSRYGNNKCLRYVSRLMLSVAARRCLASKPYRPPQASTIHVLAGHPT
jgi:SAM-dependent methyltransferase